MEEKQTNNKEAKTLLIVFLLILIACSFGYTWFLKQEVKSLERTVDTLETWYNEEHGIIKNEGNHTIDITPDN